MNSPRLSKGAVLAIGALIALSAAGCTGAPAPRPQEQQPQQIMASDTLRQLVDIQPGAGRSEVVMVGKTALVGLYVDSPNHPGGFQTDLLGTLQTPTGQGTSAGTGPEYWHGAGGGVGVPPAKFGGGLAAGGAVRGGSPASTQAAPNGVGGAASAGSVRGFEPTSGGLGASPMSVMNRIANQIRSRHREVAEVRFTIQPADAARLYQIAGEIRGGADPNLFTLELEAIRDRAMLAGDIPMERPHNDSNGVYRSN